MNNNRIQINWRLIGVLLAVAVLLLAAFSLASAGSQPEVWNQAEPIPVADGFASFSVQCPDQPDSLYLVGGVTNWVDYPDVYRYNADTNSWTELAPMLQARRAAALACYEGKIYLAGGIWGSVRSSLYIYDIASDTWSQGADLPDVVWGAFMGAWDGKLYLAGGSRGDVPYVPVDRVDVYDIATDTWTAGGGTHMLVATDFAGSVQAGFYLYIAGGVVGDGMNLHDETQRYNMATDTWELGPTLTIPQWGAGLAISGSRLYLLGGSDSIVTWNPLDKVDVLELTDWPGGAWVDLGDPLPWLSLYTAAACTNAIVGGEIWATGGTDGDAMFYNDNLYHPAEPCVSFGVHLAPEYLPGEGYPGTIVDYELTITNTGNIDDYFRLNATSDWTVTLPETVGPLGAGESEVINISVSIPPEAEVGDFDTAVITAASISNPAQADSSTITTTVITGWFDASNIPIEVSFYSIAQCTDDPNGFYVIGGAEELENPSDDIWHYDYDAENDWVLVTEMSVATWGMATTCYAGSLYIAGGWDSPYLFNRYDIASNTWYQLHGIPRFTYGAAMGAWDGKIYIVGGYGVDPWIPTDVVSVYDIASNSWSSDPVMPVATMATGTAQTGPYLYIVGGFSGNWNNNVNATQRLDMSTGTWELGPEFTSRRAAFGLSATQDHLYAVGGDSNGGERFEPTDLVEMLDLSQWPEGAWVVLSDPLPQTLEGNTGGFCTESIIGGEFWSVGGAYGSFPDPIAVDDAYYHPAEPCVSFGVHLAPEYLPGEGYPGTIVDYELTITNTGNIDDYFRLNATSDWTVTLPETVGPLGAGESEVINISVSIPPEAEVGDFDTAVITAASISNPAQMESSTLTTTVLLLRAVEFDADSLALSGNPGETITYTLLLSNAGNITDTYDLSLSGNLWDAELSANQITLAAGESAAVIVNVTIPPDALAGAVDIATLTAVSQGDPDFFDSAALTTTYPVVYGLELKVDETELTGMPGEAVTFSVQISNMGNITDTYDLDCLGDEWPMDMPVTQVSLEVGESVDVVLTVHIPLQAKPGEWDAMTFTAVSQGDPDEAGSAELTTTVTGNLFYLPVIVR